MVFVTTVGKRARFCSIVHWGGDLVMLIWLWMDKAKSVDIVDDGGRREEWVVKGKAEDAD